MQEDKDSLTSIFIFRSSVEMTSLEGNLLGLRGLTESGLRIQSLLGSLGSRVFDGFDVPFALFFEQSISHTRR